MKSLPATMEVKAMLNLTILRQDWRQNRRLWLAFAVLMLLCGGAILTLYDPVQGLKDTALLDSMPGSLVKGFGIDLQDNSLTGFIASYLFGICYLVIPLLYTLILANRLVAAPVQSGMMSYYLAAPEKRSSVIVAKAYLLCSSLFGLFLIVGLAEFFLCQILYPAELEIPQYLLLWVGAFCVHLCLGGIVFVISCICDEVKTSAMIGVGLTLLFLLFCLLGRMGGGLEILSYATPFSLFCPLRLLMGETELYWKLPTAGISGIVLCWLGGKLFEKKDLPL